MSGDSWQLNWERGGSDDGQRQTKRSGAMSSVFSDLPPRGDGEDEKVLVRHLERTALLDSAPMGDGEEQRTRGSDQGIAARLREATGTAAGSGGAFSGAATVAGRVDVSRGGLFNFWDAAEPAEELNVAAVEMRKQLHRSIGSRGVVAGVAEAPTREERGGGVPLGGTESAVRRGSATRVGLDAVDQLPRPFQASFDSPSDSPEATLNRSRDDGRLGDDSAVRDGAVFVRTSVYRARGDDGVVDIDDDSGEALRHFVMSGDPGDSLAGKQMYRLFVVGLPPGITQAELFGTFQRFGQVYLDQREVRIHRTPDDRLYSFILYDNVHSYRSALAADGQVSIRGNVVSIEPSHGLLRGRCFLCGQIGHQSRDCFMRDRCGICGQAGHRRGDCPKREHVRCSKCGQTGHVSGDCPAAEECDVCHQVGHRRADCPVKVQSFISKQLGHRQHDFPLVEVCFACNQPGHKQADCPLYGRGSSSPAGSGRQGGSEVAGSVDGSRQRNDMRCYNCGTYGHKRSQCPYARISHRQKGGEVPRSPQRGHHQRPKVIPVLAASGAGASSGAIDGALGGMLGAMRSGGTGQRDVYGAGGGGGALTRPGFGMDNGGPDRGAPSVAGPVLVPVRDEESWGGQARAGGGVVGGGGGGVTDVGLSHFSSADGSDDSGSIGPGGGGVQLPFVDLNSNWGDLTAGTTARAAARGRPRVATESGPSRKDVRRGGIGSGGGARGGRGGASAHGGGRMGGGGVAAGSAQPEFILRVRNLPLELGDAGLRERFSRYGRLSRVSICRDNRGVSRGWGFVAFSSLQGMETAHKAEDESLFAGSRISVTPTS